MERSVVRRRSWRLTGIAKSPIYLDHHATTPVDPRVLEVMLPLFTEHFGNAASHTHAFGWRAEAVVEIAREEIAAALGATDPREIIFTSGATESNNLALRGSVLGARKERPHLITAATEHSSVLDPCTALEREDVRVTLLPVGSDGLVDPAAVGAAIDEQTVLVSVMAANNEIGVLQPLEEIGAICREQGVLFHSDAAQAVGKIPLNVEAAGLDLVSVSAHKLYGPKGVGVLFVRRRKSGRRIRLEPLLHGGGHEQGLRSGTLPVPLIAGLAKAVTLCEAERESEAKRQKKLGDRLLAALRASLPDLLLNGHSTQRLPGNLNLAFPGTAADALIAKLPDVAISSGSACSSARPEPSHVLNALGLPEDRVSASLRIGLGRGTTEAEVDLAARRLIEEVEALRGC